MPYRKIDEPTKALARKWVGKAISDVIESEMRPGFDYQASLEWIRQFMTDCEIASALSEMGLEATEGSIGKIRASVTPRHPIGEGLWIIYTFLKKGVEGEDAERPTLRPPTHLPK